MTNVITSTKKTLKEVLIEKDLELGGNGADNEGLFETLEECYATVVEDDHDKRRWYTNFRVVKKVDIDGEDRYFAYYDMSVHGDGSKSDCGWEIPDIDEDVFEVYPKEVVSIDYVCTK